MVEPSYNFRFDAMAFPGFDAAEADLEQSRPLNAQEAQDLRRRLPSLSPWGVIVGQCLVGVAVVLLTWLVSGDAVRAWSVAYGALVVVLPAAVFARGLKSQFSSLNVITAGLGFFLWEIVKISLSVGMLFAAPGLVDEIDWLFLLLGLFVTMKVYWLALVIRPKQKTGAGTQTMALNDVKPKQNLKS